MTIKIYTYADGRQDYATDNASVINKKEDPITTNEIEIPDTEVDAFFANPKKYLNR